MIILLFIPSLSAWIVEAGPLVSQITNEAEPPLSGGGVFDSAIFDSVIFDTGNGAFTVEAEPALALISEE